MTYGSLITKKIVSTQKPGLIRRKIQTTNSIPSLEFTTRLAAPEDAPAFHAFLSDPAVHAPIYTLPRPLTVESVRMFIKQHQLEQKAGEGLLFLNLNEAGDIRGYSDICVWPQWAAGELGGAVHPASQGAGQGTRGAALSFNWMFETLGLDLICETAALDNIRTAKLLDHLGFTRKGEVTSTRPDGTTRQSLVWEITKQEWQAANS